jgi:multiple sugar transport system permease protein
VRSLAVHLLFAAAAVVTLIPLLWMLAASFMPAGEASSYPPRLLPSRPTLEHYRALFTRLDVGRFLLNSTVIAGGVTLVSLLLNSMAGYALAKLRFRGRRRLGTLLAAGLVVPPQVAMLPLFLLMRELGLVNTYLGVGLPTFAGILSIFLVRQYVASLPDELLDAARVDGASELRIYWSIVLPLARPILATLATFTFLNIWNDFLWPLVVLADQRMYTLPVALSSLVGEHAQDTELMMAGSVITVLPVLVLFLLLQRHYVEGVTAGGVKG